MKTFTLIQGTVIALLSICVIVLYPGFYKDRFAKVVGHPTTDIPKATAFVQSPLRHRLELALDTPVSAVWDLVGRPERMPEFSSGLAHVAAHYSDEGHCTDYSCTFLPLAADAPETQHDEVMVWYAPYLGFASLAVEPNDFGLTESLQLIVLQAAPHKTHLRWDIHFNAASRELVQANVAGFEQALNQDIAQQLIDRFGGRIVTNYVAR